MSYDLEDKKNIIYLRNQLINAETSSLKKIYSSEEDYAFFLDTLNIALDSDPIFFILDESIIKKAEDILHEKRFDYRHPVFNTVINEIIRRINALNSLPENIKNIQRRQYVAWQQNIRETSFSGKDDFLRALAYDAQLMEKLYCGHIGEVNPIYFFSSTNYLAKVLPEFYQEDEERINLTMAQLDKHAKKRWIWNYPERAFAKDAIKNMQKVKTKEE